MLCCVIVVEIELNEFIHLSARQPSFHLHYFKVKSVSYLTFCAQILQLVFEDTTQILQLY